MTEDVLDALLSRQNDQVLTAQELADAHAQLQAAIDAYKDAWKQARQAGWARTDLVRAGMTDTSRLPSHRRSKNTKKATTPAPSTGVQSGPAGE